MTKSRFTKSYTDPTRCRSAVRHLVWLHALESGVRLPALRGCRIHQVVLERIDGHSPGVSNLPELAAATGRLHAAAHLRHLHAARVDRSFDPRPGVHISDFVTSRREVLDQLGIDVAGMPTAFYKDSNIRNFLLTGEGIAVVDFDDLTLAPFGYDLAKLVVSTAMTYGRLADRAVSDALDAYNAATAQAGPAVACTRRQLDAYAEVHHVLTAPFLGRNGYRYAWPDVRPAHQVTP